MSHWLAQDFSADALSAVERASHALGRLEATLEFAGGSVVHALAIRQAVAICGTGVEGAVALLLLSEAAVHRELAATHAVLPGGRAGPSSAEILFEALAEASAPVPDAARGRLEEVVAPELKLSAVVRAGAAFGAIVSSVPATRETLRVATLASEILLASSEIAPRARVAPTQLDAATRGAAVQIERSSLWSEWIRTWSLRLAREAGTTERRVRDLQELQAGERTTARAKERVGSTDETVLAHLQGAITFTIPSAVPVLGLSAPTIGTSIERLEAAGVATELTGQKRDRIWVSTALLDFMVGR
jgi:hypothetical protein